MPNKLVVLGMGYVGTVTAACFASLGHDVWGVDIDPAKVNLLKAGSSTVVEPGLDKLVQDAVAAGNLHASTRLDDAVEGADVCLICVGTPSMPQGGTDLRPLRRVVDELGRALLRAGNPDGGFRTVVVRSTVPPGTVDGEVAPALKEYLGDGETGNWGTAMCPEFLREGSSVEDFFNPPITVLGTQDERVGRSLRALFSFVPVTPHVVETKTAEALKYASNAFHATKVSFTNELARLFRELGVDARSVMDLFGEDHCLNISTAYLRPGFAFGGSCLPKDLRALLHLARMNSVDLPLLGAALESNNLTVKGVVERVLMAGASKVALIGLSFKAESDDLRESPSVELAELLLGKGCELRIYDPVLQPSRLRGANRSYVEARLPHLGRLLAATAAEALGGADTVIVSSVSGEIHEAILSAAPSHVFDLVGRIGQDIEALPGYEGVGW